MDPDPSPTRIDPTSKSGSTRRGSGPATPVRIVRPFETEFERGENGHLVATSETLLSPPGIRRALAGARSFLIGRPISSEREEHERSPKLKALAVFSSDNIGSSAYATEEMMRVLVVAGVGAFALVMPLTLVIVVVLATVATSYRQTIKAYPHGASSYIVASDNLGAPAGPGGSRSAADRLHPDGRRLRLRGVAAITSMVPALYPKGS